MSVTFTIEANPTGTFTIGCYDPEQGDVEVARADSYEDILVERAAHMAVCEECGAYGCYAQAVMDVSEEFDVNVSNMNARTLLDALGLDGGDDLVGGMDAETFLGAVLLAMASDRDDSGVAPVDVYAGIGGGARVVDCGLRPGYFADRFGAFYALATEAVRLGRDVVWS